MAISDIDPVAANRASVASRRRRIAERAELAQIVTPMVENFQREEVGPKLVKMALDLATVATSTEITPETALEVKQLADAAQILHKMGRLEMGESTSNSATFDATNRDAQLVALRARLAELDVDATTPSDT